MAPNPPPRPEPTDATAQTTKTYDVEVEREGDLWVFAIPALAYVATPTGATIVPHGQARTADRIAFEARAIIAMWTGLPFEEISVSLRLVDDDGDTAMSETLAILSDPEAMAEIAAAQADFAAGREFTLEAVESELRAAGRL